jgi:hypothetical protein
MKQPLRQTLIYLLLSIAVVLFSQYVHLMIVYIDMFYTYINIQLAPIFSSSHSGIMIRKVLSLVLLPIVIAAVPALIYRAIKGKNMAYFLQVTWFLWLVIVLSKVLIR